MLRGGLFTLLKHVLHEGMMLINGDHSNTSMDTRRDFIKKAALLAGGAGAWDRLPLSIQKALSVDPEEGSSFHDAEHIVLLMQENRSFDHCFGTLQGVRGFNDPRAISLANGNLVWLQSDQLGQTYAPFRLDIHHSKITWMESLPHSWGNQVDARNDGRYDGWLEAKRSGIKAYSEMPLTMGYYNREDIPFYYAFADAFTICDQHFCSSLTGTTTNRLFFWSGTLKAKSGDTANVRNSDVYFNREVAWKTFPERLQEAGISWKVYQNELSVQTELSGEDESWLGNYTDNNLEWFKQYHVRFSKGHHHFLTKRLAALPEEIAALEIEISQMLPAKRQKQQRLLEQKIAQQEKFEQELEKYNPANFHKLSAFEQHLHRRAFTDNSGDPNYHETTALSWDEGDEEQRMNVPKGDVLYQFRKDVREGKLSTVSWLVAPQNFSDHPSAPWYGAWYISEILDILTENPEVWKKTIFILNYDENDGCFDHVPPFIAPKPGDPDSGAVSSGLETADEFVTMEEELRRDRPESDPRESPVGLGYRVPLIIASPWTRGGWVNSEVCDITSTLRFMEHFLSKKTGKAIREDNISSWRRCITGDLTSCFRPFQGEASSFDAFVDYKSFMRSIYQAQFQGEPDNFKKLSEAEINDANEKGMHSAFLPKQEPGIRDSCALPYQLAVAGALNSEKTGITLAMSVMENHYGMPYLGCPFNVYAPGAYLQMNKQSGEKKFEALKAWSYAVRCGDALRADFPLDHFEDSRYHLRVYGPNGYFVELTGSKADPGLGIEVQNELKNGKETGNVLIRIEAERNVRGLNFTLHDNSYGTPQKRGKLKANQTLLVSTEESFGWYDFTFSIEEYSGYSRRYAGRMENGKQRKSDPLMA